MKALVMFLLLLFCVACEAKPDAPPTDDATTSDVVTPAPDAASTPDVAAVVEADAGAKDQGSD